MSEGRPCPVCNSENLADRRFCRHCGAVLDGAVSVREPLPVAAALDLPGLNGPADPVPGERLTSATNRLATIVKADLSGFTAMSELLADAEMVTDIMNQVFDPLVGCVRRYGGHIDNYAGDMIIAFFGAPETREGGAERAVRAALDMRDEVERLNSRNISHGVELGISTGVATGYGLWGEVGVGSNLKMTLSGELGDYAALLEKFAERGTVGICPDTRARTQHVLDAAEQESQVTPPGEEQSRSVYFAGEPYPATPWLAALEADLPPLSGREAELRQLTELLDQATAAGAALHVGGEAGIGKTRLLLEFARHAREAGALVCAVGGRPLGQALGDDFETELARAVLAAAGVAEGDPKALAAWLESLGLDRGEQDLTAWLNAVGARQRLVLILDGLEHWAPWPATLLQTLFGSGAVLLFGGRSRSVLRPLGAHAAEVDELLLAELDRDAAADLVQARLGQPSAAQREFVQRWSEGNPLFSSEFCDWLVQRHEPVAEYETALRAMPWRVQELWDQAVDALAPDQHAVLLAAACAADDNLTFDPRQLTWLTEAGDWARCLDELLAAGLLRGGPDPTRLAFRHRSLRFVCRRRLTDSVRAELEQLAAAARQQLGG